MQDTAVSRAITFEANLDASQVVSNPTASQATATATFTLSPDLTQLNYELDFSGLNLELQPENRVSVQDINKIHLHVGPPSQRGPHVLNIFGLPSEDDSNLVVDFENERLSGIWDNSDAVNPDTGLFFDQSLGGSTKFLSDFVDELQSGNLYVAVHTAGLEGQVAIRGQIQPVEVSTTNPSSPISFTDIAVRTHS